MSLALKEVPGQLPGIQKHSGAALNRLGSITTLVLYLQTVLA
jgi:hypothetical protein